MEAEERDTIKTKSELQFFELIEKKMEQLGYEVLDTLDRERMRTVQSKGRLARRLTGFPIDV
jgi:hypothetical protein